MYTTLNMSDGQARVSNDLESEWRKPLRFIGLRQRVPVGTEHMTVEGDGTAQIPPWNSGHLRRYHRRRGEDRPTIEDALERGVTFLSAAPHDAAQYGHGSWTYYGDVSPRNVTHPDEEWSHIAERIRVQAEARGNNLWLPNYNVLSPELGGQYQNPLHEGLIHMDAGLLQIAWAGRSEEYGLVIGFPGSIRYLGSIQAYESLLRKSVEWAIENLGEDTTTPEERAARNRERFVAMAKNRVEARITEERNEITELERVATTHQDNYLSTLRQLHERSLTISGLQAQAEGVKQETGITPESEWEALQRHTKIKEVRVTSTLLKVRTIELTMTNPHSGEQAILGEMEIDIPLINQQDAVSRMQGGVRVHNLTNAREGRPHPHCSAAEGACLGSIGTEVARLVVRGEVGGAVEMMIAYLESFNPDDSYGKYAEYWDFRRAGNVEAAAR